uniref:Uncharacterized protein n=1 Tax=Tetranychus urticae TaxID=32264 RepID=T1JZJ8_TETUR
MLMLPIYWWFIKFVRLKGCLHFQGLAFLNSANKFTFFHPSPSTNLPLGLQIVGPTFQMAIMIIESGHCYEPSYGSMVWHL